MKTRTLKPHALTFALLATFGMSAAALAQDTPIPVEGEIEATVDAEASTNMADQAIDAEAAAQASQAAAQTETAAEVATDTSNVAGAVPAQAPTAPPMPPTPPAAPVPPVPPTQAPPPVPAANVATEAEVTFTSSPSNSVVGEYTIDFAAMDTDGDGNISRAEAKSNATLTAEYAAVDIDSNGRLSKSELQGWM